MRRECGLIVVIIFTVASACSAVNLATNPGFETTETTQGGWPSTYGDWKGDHSAIVSTTSGINPFEGSQMLQFMGTSSTDHGSSTTCQIYQIVDVGSFADLIASGQGLASASAYFNRVAGDSQTDTLFGIAILACTGEPSTFASQKTTAPVAGLNFVTDDNPNTWELASVQMLLPTNTDFIAVGIYMNEDIYNDTFEPEFDGHFADIVSVTIVPEPATTLLLSIGICLIRRKLRD
jgi:hypothetical protein